MKTFKERYEEILHKLKSDSYFYSKIDFSLSKIEILRDASILSMEEQTYINEECVMLMVDVASSFKSSSIEETMKKANELLK